VRGGMGDPDFALVRQRRGGLDRGEAHLVR
jgi:hypothetical protein